jgi:hypothetical protein
MKTINFNNVKTIELQDKRDASNQWTVVFTSDDTYSVFKLFSWPPHFEKRKYTSGCVSENGYGGHILYGEGTLARYNAFINNEDRKVYYEPRIIITYIDSSSEYFYFRDYKNALAKYNELNNQLRKNNKSSDSNKENVIEI